MNPRDLRRVGETALQVTRLGFGAGAIGGMYAPVSDEQASGAIQSALGLGVLFFDVAPLYGHGTSEMRLGEVLRSGEQGGPASSFGSRRFAGPFLSQCRRVCSRV